MNTEQKPGIVKTGEKMHGVSGSGINVNSTVAALANIDIPATSLCCEIQRKVVRQDLLEKLLEIISKVCRSFGCSNGGQSV